MKTVYVVILSPFYGCPEQDFAPLNVLKYWLLLLSNASNNQAGRVTIKKHRTTECSHLSSHLNNRKSTQLLEMLRVLTAVSVLVIEVIKITSVVIMNNGRSQRALGADDVTNEAPTRKAQ